MTPAKLGPRARFNVPPSPQFRRRRATSGPRLPDFDAGRRFRYKLAPSSSHPPPAPSGKDSGPHTAEHNRPKLFLCVRTANMGVYRFLSTESQDEIREGWFRADKNHPKKPCCHLRPGLDLSKFRLEGKLSDADGDGNIDFGAPRPRGTGPTSRWLMRLVGLHARMTTPVAHCCGAGLGAAGRPGGINVGDTRPPRGAASAAVSGDSRCGGPPARR